MEHIEYKYGRKTISAKLKFSDRRTIGLKVFPEGNIEVKAPFNTNKDVVIEKIKTKSKWIVTQQRAFELYKPFSTERKYIAGETHRYLGRQYKLSVETNEKVKPSIKLSKGSFIITTPEINDVEKIITNYYQLRADVIFSELLESLLNEHSRFKDYEVKLKHRFLKKRWGSCSIKGTILLNTELIKASKICIEYVILHELCHLIHPNHSKEFYNLLTEIFPLWKKIKDKLERELA